MNNERFDCTIKIGDSIQSKLESYLETHRVLLRSSFHEDLLKNVETLKELIETHDKGANDLPEIYRTWVSSWDSLYAENDEGLKALGITREALLFDKRKFETEVFPALLTAADKCSDLIPSINSFINKLKLQDKKEK